MKIIVEFEEEDIVPCLCKISPLLTATAVFGARLVVDASYVGRIFGEKLKKNRVPVEIQEKP